MTDFDYPPTTTLTLGVALADAEDRVQADDDDEDGEGDDRSPETDRDALAWAVSEFGEDATITLEAFTTTTRSRTIDTLNRTVMGPAGAQQLSDWMIAAATVEAPWLEGDEDLPEKAQITGQLPPALTDWLNAELDDLNDLSAGN